MTLINDNNDIAYDEIDREHGGIHYHIVYGIDAKNNIWLEDVRASSAELAESIPEEVIHSELEAFAQEKGYSFSNPF